jgi:hypothetical protein
MLALRGESCTIGRQREETIERIAFQEAINVFRYK